MGLIFDTSIWIGLATGEQNARAIIEIAKEAPVFVSVFSLGELEFGVESCTDPAVRAARAAFQRQLERRPVLGATKQTAAAFGLLAASVKQAGRSPRPRYNDLWIAAQAIEHGYALLTANSPDFAALPGLRVLSL
jgi:predicted nucleic acid-binding protein